MIEVDAGAPASRARRRTWMLGGALFAIAAVIGLWVTNFPGIGFARLPDVLFAAGAVVFAVGIGRAGSVTARRPLGTTALVALGGWVLLSPLLMLLVPTPSFDGAIGFRYETVVGALSMSLQVVTLMLAIIAVVQIGRIAVLPRPWRWAPLWALCVVVGVQLLPTAIVLGGAVRDQGALAMVYSVGSLLYAVALGSLGVIAMMLATRAANATTAVLGADA